ncbi:hypothetical protein [Streptomyces sp. NPDC088348]
MSSPQASAAALGGLIALVLILASQHGLSARSNEPPDGDPS